MKIFIIRVKEAMALFTGLAVLMNAYGAIVVTPVGDGSGYDILGTGAAENEATAYRSTGVAKSFDIDDDSIYGTEGLFMFGDGGAVANGQPFTKSTQVGASWAAFSAGANWTSVAQDTVQGPMDNPTLTPAATVADWGTVGFATGADLDAGNWGELVEITFTAATPQKFRIGLVAGTQSATNHRWDPTGLRITDGGTTVYASVTGLEANPVYAAPNWVFFDVNLNGEISGTLAIQGQQRLNTQGPGLTGITFDVIPLTGSLPPIAIDQDLTTFPDTALEITLTGVDPEGSNLTYNVVSEPVNGTLTTNGVLPDLTYTPTNGYNGADSFTFTVNDGLLESAPATISIGIYSPMAVALAGDGSGYDETGMQGFRSTNVEKVFDGDYDNVYGTEGLFFIGNSALTPLPDRLLDTTFANFTKVGATWADFSPGAKAGAYNSPDAAWDYADIDDPAATPGVDVADWDIQSGWVRSGAAGTGFEGEWEELLTFTIDDTTPKKFRVGVMAANMNGDQYHPTGLRITADPGAAYEVTQSVTNLPTVGTVKLTGMVFFDVDLKGRTSGSFSVLAERPSDAQGAGIAGITFDRIVPLATVILVY